MKGIYGNSWLQIILRGATSGTIYWIANLLGWHKTKYRHALISINKRQFCKLDSSFYFYKFYFYF